jgi:hypothetical protein
VELSASKASDLMGCGEFLQCLMLIRGLKLLVCWLGLLQTVNDVFLAMLDASLHRYLQNHYHKELHPPDHMGMQTL